MNRFGFGIWGHEQRKNANDLNNYEWYVVKYYRDFVHHNRH